MSSLADRVRSLRLGSGLTLARVAEGAELSVPFIADIEHGRRMPSLDALVRIAAVFDLDVVTFLQGVEPFDASQSVDKGEGARKA